MLHAFFKRIIDRDQMTGKAFFEANPGEACHFAKDGIVVCEGYPGLYDTGTPIMMNGSYDEKKETFFASEIYIPSHTKTDSINLLNFLSKGLSCHQAEILADVIGDDYFGFMEEKGAAQSLLKKLKISCEKKDWTQTVTGLIQKSQDLLDSEKTFRELAEAGIPIDRIELLLEKRIYIDQIRNNPYKYLLPFGVHIKNVEAIASKQDWFSEYHIERLKGFTWYAALQSESGGDTCMEWNSLLNRINFLFREFGALPTVMDWSLLHLCIRKMPEYIGYQNINNKTYLYIEHIWDEESLVIANILRINASKRLYTERTPIQEIENEFGITYNQGQKNAFQALRSSGIKILTGPPGSGKTAVIRGFLKNFENDNFCLSATTGRAATVMASATGEMAQTVNRLLNVRPFGDNYLAKGANDPLVEDLVIVDEVSMLGLQLFSILLSAVRSGACLVLVGDENQLLSVDYGNVLHDLIRSGVIEVYRLTEVMRQSGTIHENASWVNSGTPEMIRQDSSFQVVRCKDDESLAKTLLSYKPQGKDKTQVLTPVHRGEAGTWELNRKMEDTSRELLMRYGKSVYRKGDKVIMTNTNYDLDYINGSIGTVIGKKEELLIVDFDGDVKLIPRQGMHDMQHADAITIHKSQGSEFERVYICLPEAAGMMMTRRLLYTAITRARRQVIIFSSGSCLEQAVANTAERVRLTLLGDRLKT